VIAVDTNIVVRLIVRDDAKQLARAQTLMDENEMFVSLSVLLECEWVLRSRYQMKRNEVNGALLSFIRLAHVCIADRDGLKWALGRHATGADFADMIHLIDANTAEGFATFDTDLAKEAGPEAPMPIVLI
jgi:predicted nucleic-acid-binding protein